MTPLETRIRRSVTGQLRSWLRDHPDAVAQGWAAVPPGETEAKVILSIRKRVASEVLAVLRDQGVIPPASPSNKPK